MEKIKNYIINELNKCRKEILSVPKDKLSGDFINKWFQKWKSLFEKTDSVSSECLENNVIHRMKGFWKETDTELCVDLRTRIVDMIDKAILSVDSKQDIKPILDDLISKVADIKLSTLLKEFNASRIEQPNIASTGFRTILPLIIRERAKKIDPTHKLATKDDIGFEPDIDTATKYLALFNEAERKLLNRYLSGGDKDSFDNVAHKPDYLINKDELEDAVDLLNRLLPTII